ncbi:hypothetical protein AAGG74_16690 [Bacillus mexicanus]|uniref:hypothetical protein n=1 Tax=Bacillus mexicanus TaxID=2834415 RepID=UPI003D1CB2C4
MLFNEFFLSKVAFQAGYTNVYYNEMKNNENELATPSNWVTDSTVVSDFAFANQMEFVETKEGDFFQLIDEDLSQFLTTFSTEIENAKNMTVDDLLREKVE